MRHGEASVPWSLGRDAGLSAQGRAQAEQLATDLSIRTDWHLVSSPLLRAQETAAPLAAKLSRKPHIDGRFEEVPLADDVARRKLWLREVAGMRWADVDAAIDHWREAAWQALVELPGDSIVFTHFMLINAMLSRASGDDRLQCFEPDYTSVSEVVLAADGSIQYTFGRSLGG